jgi:drug/metabolite transporter (DMT)-like permease
MEKIAYRQSLDLKAVLLLTGICLLWGINAPAIKVSNLGVAPIFAAGIRSVIATICLIGWMKYRKMALFPGRVLDGLWVGLLFGLEFSILYTSLLYTTTSSAWILLYTSPFWHAAGAHFFLQGDRLTTSKVLGLILAFAGIVVLLSKYVNLPSSTQLLGDFLALVAALMWAVTTLVIRRRLVGHVSHHHTLFYQMVFSIPILFGLSFLFGETQVKHLDTLIVLSLAYQSVVIAFLSYIVWFAMVHVYPISGLSAFTFLTPVFATIAGAVMLGEPVSWGVIFSLVLVSVGIYVVNR